MEEDLSPRLIPVPPEELERRALRGFGLGLGALVIVFALRAHRHAFAAVGAAALGLAVARPLFFKPLYRLWMPVVAVLARVNLWLLCGILYYLVVTPYALLLRAFGLRPLELRLREKDSYWDEKPPRDPVESVKNIF
jgi:hypothetical protein